MPVSITLSDVAVSLAASGLLALAMDSLSIKLRQYQIPVLQVNFSRVSYFFYS